MEAPTSAVTPRVSAPRPGAGTRAREAPRAWTGSASGRARSGSLRVGVHVLFAADTFHVALGIAGAAFVLWAALVGGIGLTPPRLPGGTGGASGAPAGSVGRAAR